MTTEFVDHVPLEAIRPMTIRAIPVWRGRGKNAVKHFHVYYEQHPDFAWAARILHCSANGAPTEFFTEKEYQIVRNAIDPETGMVNQRRRIFKHSDNDVTATSLVLRSS